MKEIFESALIELIIMQDDDIITSSPDSTGKGIDLPEIPI